MPKIRQHVHEQFRQDVADSKIPTAWSNIISTIQTRFFYYPESNEMDQNVIQQISFIFYFHM